LAEDIGLTEDQLSQVVATSKLIPPAIKKVGESFADPARIAREFAEAQKKSADEIVGRYTKLSDEGKKTAAVLIPTIKTISDAIAYQNFLESKGLITAQESLTSKIKLREEEIDRIIKAGAAVGSLSVADQVRIEQLRGFNADNQAALDEISTDQAWATQTALMEEFYQRDAELQTQAEKDEADAWATQFAFMEEFQKRDEEASKAEIERRREVAKVTFDIFSALTNALSAVFASINQRGLDDLDLTYQKQKELIENNGLTKKEALEKNLADAKAAGDAEEIADAEKQLKLFQLEEAYTKKKAQLQFEAAHAQWMAQVALATASTARAVVEALPNIPLSIIAGVLGAAGIAATVAAEPQPPRFATGGIVLPSGQSGQQVTVGDQGGGDILFGTGALGQPLMQGFADLVAEKVSRMVGMKPVQFITDGKVQAQGVVDWINSGQVRLNK